MPIQNSISEKVQRWSATEAGATDYNAIHALIEYLAKRLYSHYSADFGPNPGFRARLAAWIDNLPDDEDQKLLFKLVPSIFFVGPDEMKALQRASFRGPILQWIIDDAQLRFDDPAFHIKLMQEVQRTWFCAITDSARITDFYHVNNITGSEHRPDWRFLADSASGAIEILSHVKRGKYARVVLTEDIVGSGSQMSDLVPLFSQLPLSLHILLAPLIVCPLGQITGQRIAQAHSHVAFKPTMALPSNAFVGPTEQVGEPAFFKQLREFVLRTYPKVSDGTPLGVKPYGPYGYRDTGGVFVTASNTPDNTIPAVHHSSRTWKPLFPRKSRV